MMKSLRKNTLPYYWSFVGEYTGVILMQLSLVVLWAINSIDTNEADFR